MKEITQAEIEQTVKSITATVLRNEQYFSELDAAAGDADFGIDAPCIVKIGLRARREIAIGRCDRVRQYLEIARCRELQATQFARRRQARQVELPWQGRPIGPLSPPLDVAHEVHTPNLRRRSVAKRAQRDSDLCRPPTLATLRHDLPASVPAGVGVALIPDLTVVLNPRNVRAKRKSVLAVPKGIQDYLEGVLVPQASIAARVGDHDL